MKQKNLKINPAAIAVLAAVSEHTGEFEGQIVSACIFKHAMDYGILKREAQLGLFNQIVGSPMTAPEIAMLARLFKHRPHIGPQPANRVRKSKIAA